VFGHIKRLKFFFCRKACLSPNLSSSSMSSEYLQMVIGLMDAFLLSRWVLEVLLLQKWLHHLHHSQVWRNAKGILYLHMRRTHLRNQNHYVIVNTDDTFLLTSFPCKENCGEYISKKHPNMTTIAI